MHRGVAKEILAKGGEPTHVGQGETARVDEIAIVHQRKAFRVLETRAIVCHSSGAETGDLWSNGQDIRCPEHV